MTPPPPGCQATTERHAALASSTPLLDRVFPPVECEDWRGDLWADAGLNRLRGAS